MPSGTVAIYNSHVYKEMGCRQTETTICIFGLSGLTTKIQTVIIKTKLDVSKLEIYYSLE